MAMASLGINATFFAILCVIDKTAMVRIGFLKAFVYEAVFYRIALSGHLCSRARAVAKCSANVLRIYG